MEGHRMVVCGATQIIGLLIFIYLFYIQSLGIEPIKISFGTRNLLKLNATMEEGGIFEDTMQLSFKSLIGDADLQKLETTGFACDSTVDSLVCVASNPVKIDTKTMNIYMPRHELSSINNNSTNFSIKNEVKSVQVRPYSWAQFELLLKYVTPVNFLQQPPESSLYCDYTDTIPAVVFSSGGFAGNLFHEFNEIIIPLFMTTRLFKSRVKLILVDYNPSFVTKYRHIFSSLSNYDVLKYPSKNTSVHCFAGAVVGLKFHSYLSINSSEVPKGNSMLEFRKFIQTTYNLKITNVTSTKAPTLILISRRKTRRFLNEDEMVDMMEDLGFDVVVVRSNKQMSNLDRFAKLVNTASVLVGAHGAGLTNQVFLPSGAVVVQVVPLALEWPSSAYFGGPAVGMGLHYMDYKIGPNESSLIESYPRNDPVISDPGSVFAKGYFVGKEMYLDKQNVRVDVNRFKNTLVEAIRLLGRL